MTLNKILCNEANFAALFSLSPPCLAQHFGLSIITFGLLVMEIRIKTFSHHGDYGINFQNYLIFKITAQRSNDALQRRVRELTHHEIKNKENATVREIP